MTQNDYHLTPMSYCHNQTTWMPILFLEDYDVPKFQLGLDD